MGILSKKMTAADERELRAHLYQQLAKVEPYLKVPGAMGFEFFEDEKGGGVRLFYRTPFFNIEADSHQKNEFDASNEATEKLIETIVDMDEEGQNLPEGVVIKKEILH